MKTEALLSRLSERDAREVWEKKGSLDTHTRAMQRVNEILSHTGDGLIPADVDASLHTRFKDLVSGKLEIPQGG